MNWSQFRSSSVHEVHACKQSQQTAAVPLMIMGVAFCKSRSHKIYFQKQKEEEAKANKTKLNKAIKETTLS